MQPKWFFPLTLLLSVAAYGCSDPGGNEHPNDNTHTPAGPTNNSTKVPSGPSNTKSEIDPASIPGVAGQIEGLTGPVSFKYDTDGIGHIKCEKSSYDCFRMLGYVHAKYRFFQMEVRRRYTKGTLTEALGRFNDDKVFMGLSLIDIDKLNRTKFLNRDGKSIFEEAYNQLPPDSDAKKIIDAYTAGVNTWITDATATREGKDGTIYKGNLLLGHEDKGVEKIPSIFSMAGLVLGFDYEIDPWTVNDTVAVGFALLANLSDHSGRDIAATNAVIAAKEHGEGDPVREKKYQSMARALIKPLSFFDVSVYGTANNTKYYSDKLSLIDNYAGKTIGRSQDEHLTEYKEVISAAASYLKGIEEFEAFLFGPRGSLAKGSNNWIVHKDKTENGETIMANDPHLTLTQPALWFPVEINSTAENDKLHSFGVTFAGFPGTLLGHNEKIAWGGTVVNYDLADVYTVKIEEKTDGTLYTTYTDGDEGKVQKVNLTFKVASKDAQTKKKKIEEITEEARVHKDLGPILPFKVKGEKDKSLAFRWVGQEAGSDLEAFFMLQKATDQDSAKKALKKSTTTNQNWLIADKDNIGWYPYSKVPNRQKMMEQVDSDDNQIAMPWFVLDGSEKKNLWKDYIPYEKLPQLTNPPKKYIASANSDITGQLYNFGKEQTPVGRAKFAYLQSYPAPGVRLHRILTQLYKYSSGTKKISVADMEKLQHDYKVEFAELLKGWTKYMTYSENWPGPYTDVDKQERFNKYRKLLHSWLNNSQSCPSGYEKGGTVKTKDTNVIEASRGCLAFHIWVGALYDQLIQPLNDKFFGSQLANPSDPATLEGLNIAYLILSDLEANLEDKIYAPENGQAFSAVDYLNFAFGNNFTDKDTSIELLVEMIDTKAFEFYDSLTTVCKKEGEAPVTEVPLWGDLHKVQLKADLLGEVEAAASLVNHEFLPGYGGLLTVNVANPSKPSRISKLPERDANCNFVMNGDQKNLVDTYNPDFGYPYGASMRLIAAFKDDQVVTRFSLPGGSMFNKGDVFYDNLLADWIDGKYITVNFTPDKVATAVEAQTTEPGISLKPE